MLPMEGGKSENKFSNEYGKSTVQKKEKLPKRYMDIREKTVKECIHTKGVSEKQNNKKRNSCKICLFTKFTEFTEFTEPYLLFQSPPPDVLSLLCTTYKV